MAIDSGAPAPVAGPAPASATQGTFGQGDGGKPPVASNTPAMPARISTPAPAPGPAATPPAAPAAPAAPTPPAPPAEPLGTVGDVQITDVVIPAAEPGAVTYEPTGNPKLDISLSFLAKVGIKADSPEMKAAEAGDFSILKATLATMGDKARGWEANVALGESAYQDVMTATATRRAADQKAVLEVVGGEDNWKAVKTFAAQATADSPAERAQVNAALNAGGVAAKAMAAYLHSLYMKHSDTQTPAAAVIPGAAATPPSATNTSNAPLSPREYTNEVQKLSVALRNKGGIDNSPQYAALKARRSAWRAR